ncbi:arylsulfatase [Novosphingobium sp. TH158]|uniref:arylsulfatase n=1 Tax=Novosphingobium sp. TH158 TaxID=2067455 RepID=UPI001304420D|nr:arylsulfatase [Novosphingobium sp. TH158]
MKMRMGSMAAMASSLALAVCIAGSARAQQATQGSPPVAASQRQEQRPNVLVWMLDDIGFAQLSCFGGLVATPNIDRVARMGLVYANYRTAAICSASRAAILSGRNPHTVHLGGHAASARPFPGYDAQIPPSAGSIAANLRQAGYRTFALGKWDHLPASEASPAGPYTQWPTGQGFDRFYGFLAADADNWNPILIRDTTPVARPTDPMYHLNRDLADRAIAMIGDRDAAGSPAPFFMYWATGTAHAPHHAPREWIERYRGQFDMGWDKAREIILKNQIAKGLVPKGTKLAPRPAEIPAWESLTSEQKRLYAHQMEVFAASVGYADHEFGRILDDLQARGELENTMVIVTSDNGASAEGGRGGMHNEAALVTGAYPDDAENMAYLDRWGGPETYPHYSAGWAVAGNTPFRYWKQVTHEGGIHVPLVVSWPKGIAARGELRRQFVNVTDISPTILNATGVSLAETVNNVKQQPMDGVSFAYSFTAREPNTSRPAQYYELHGNKALIDGEWSINTTHRIKTWDNTSSGAPSEAWELYNIARDPGQTTDLAAREPERTSLLAKEFEAQAVRYNVYPLGGIAESVQTGVSKFAANFRSRGGKWRYSGTVGNIPAQVAPPVSSLGFTMKATLDLFEDGATGPIFASGGQLGGMGLYLREGKPVLVLRSLSGQVKEVAANVPIAAGKATVELAFSGTRGSPEHDVEIKVNGQRVASEAISFAIPASFGISEVFGVGIDNGSTVLSEARADTPISGRIEDILFDFSSSAQGSHVSSP